MMMRAMNYDPRVPAYDVMVRTASGDHYSQITEDELSAMIRDNDQERDSTGGECLRALRRLTHRFPWSWVPMTAITSAERHRRLQ